VADRDEANLHASDFTEAYSDRHWFLERAQQDRDSEHFFRTGVLGHYPPQRHDRLDEAAGLEQVHLVWRFKIEEEEASGEQELFY